MNEALTQALYTEFRQLYAGRHKPAQESAMCWGFECGDGWYGLLEDLSKELTDYSRKNLTFHLEATQVKSKFGVLRFHLAENSACTDTMIDRARQVAAGTCEITGAPGALCVKEDASHRNPEYKVMCAEKAIEHGFVPASQDRGAA